MRVVHLSYYYGNNISGAPVAAMRLHNALLRKGIESCFICTDQRMQGINILRIPRSRYLSRLFYLLTRGMWVLSRILLGRMLMTNILPLPGFCKEIRKIHPDIIHVHFISQDMLSFSQLASLRVPIVFTLRCKP